MTEMKKLPSLSTKSLGYTAKEIRKLVEDKNEAVFLARYGGVVSEQFVGEGTHGQWVGFKGQFIAVKADGTQYESSVAFFPNNIASGLVAKMNEGLVDLEVRADVFAVETTKNASGYAYMCEPVITAEAMNRFQKLQTSLFDSPLPQSAGLLEAPKATKAIAGKTKAA